MKSRIKFSCLFLTMLAALFSGAAAYAQVDQTAVASILNAALDPTTIPTTLLPGTFSSVLCSIRLLLCGKMELTIVGTGIFMLGMLIFSKKLRWPYALLIVSCIVIFIDPQGLVKTILKDFMGITIAPLGIFADICTCTIINQVPWL